MGERTVPFGEPRFDEAVGRVSRPSSSSAPRATAVRGRGTEGCPSVPHPRAGLPAASRFRGVRSHRDYRPHTESRLVSVSRRTLRAPSMTSRSARRPTGLLSSLPFTTRLDDPPPSRLRASSAPIPTMIAASSSNRTPRLRRCRPSTRSSRRVPSALMPAAVRGWVVGDGRAEENLFCRGHVGLRRSKPRPARRRARPQRPKASTLPDRVVPVRLPGAAGARPRPASLRPDWVAQAMSKPAAVRPKAARAVG